MDMKLGKMFDSRQRQILIFFESGAHLVSCMCIIRYLLPRIKLWNCEG